jgi:hypothetical protein
MSVIHSSQFFEENFDDGSRAEASNGDTNEFEGGGFSRVSKVDAKSNVNEIIKNGRRSIHLSKNITDGVEQCLESIENRRHQIDASSAGKIIGSGHGVEDRSKTNSITNAFKRSLKAVERTWVGTIENRNVGQVASRSGKMRGEGWDVLGRTEETRGIEKSSMLGSSIRRLRWGRRRWSTRRGSSRSGACMSTHEIKRVHKARLEMSESFFHCLELLGVGIATAIR